MKTASVLEALNRLAPLSYAADWDNVGLLIGSAAGSTQAILLTIDLTEPVLEEAIGLGADLIVAYHPPLFHPIKTLTDVDPHQRIILGAAASDIAVYSPHTALDAAPGGVNDWLAKTLGPGDVRALEPHAELPPSQACKIVTFCPADGVGELRKAMAAVGAGRIGDYELCSFETSGQGTFLGGEGTTPKVGQRGRMERVEEVRLEMVCPRDSLGLAVVTLRQFHPYEEPPVEIYQLHPRPQRHIGQGRRVVLDEQIDLKTLAPQLKKTLGVRQLQVATPARPPRKYGVIGLCPGAGGSLAQDAIAQGCELFLTGEMRHHDVLAAQAAGCTVILAGHTNTERGYLRTFKARLLRDPALSQATVPVHVSKRDGDPLRVV